MLCFSCTNPETCEMTGNDCLTHCPSVWSSSFNKHNVGLFYFLNTCSEQQGFDAQGFWNMDETEITTVQKIIDPKGAAADWGHDIWRERKPTDCCCWEFLFPLSLASLGRNSLHTLSLTDPLDVLVRLMVQDGCRSRSF